MAMNGGVYKGWYISYKGHGHEWGLNKERNISCKGYDISYKGHGHKLDIIQGIRRTRDEIHCRVIMGVVLWAGHRVHLCNVPMRFASHASHCACAVS
jgi:hypothetical protein